MVITDDRTSSMPNSHHLLSQMAIHGVGCRDGAAESKESAQVLKARDDWKQWSRNWDRELGMAGEEAGVGASSRESGGSRQEMGTSEGRDRAGSMKPWPGQSSQETEPRLGRSRRETVLYACLDMKSIILGKYHYMLYVLVLAMRPKMLMTVDENLKLLSVPVQVGQAVDVVGQAGQPKTIMGFQMHSTLTSSWRLS